MKDGKQKFVAKALLEEISRRGPEHVVTNFLLPYPMHVSKIRDLSDWLQRVVDAANGK